MTEHLAEPFHNGESEPEALAGVALGVADLVELLKQVGPMVRVDTYAGIPDLDVDPVAARPGGQEYAAPLRLAHRVGEQVADHAPE